MFYEDDYLNQSYSNNPVDDKFDVPRNSWANEQYGGESASSYNYGQANPPMAASGYDAPQDGWGTLSQVFDSSSAGGYNPMYPAGNNAGFNQYQPEASGGAFNQYNPAPAFGDPQPTGNPKRERWLDRISPNQMDALKGVSGLAGMFAQLQKAKALKAAARTQDPFGSQRPQYQSRLSDTYNNPDSYFNRPEAMAQRALIERQMRAKAAASGGRYSASPQVARDLYADDATRLNAYRTQLANLGGSQFGPSSAAQLQAGAADAGLKAIGSPFAALGDMFGSGRGASDNAGYAQLKRDIEARLGKG